MRSFECRDNLGLAAAAIRHLVAVFVRPLTYRRQLLFRRRATATGARPATTNSAEPQRSIDIRFERFVQLRCVRRSQVDLVVDTAKSEPSWDTPA